MYFLKIFWFGVFSENSLLWLIFNIPAVWFGVFSENSLVWCGQDADLLWLHPFGMCVHQRWSRRLPRAQSTLARPGRRPVARYKDSLTRNNILTTRVFVSVFI